MKSPIVLFSALAGLGLGSVVLAQPTGFPRAVITPAAKPAPSRSYPLSGKSKLTRDAKLPKRAATRPAREPAPGVTPFPTMAFTSQYLDLQGQAKDQSRAVSVLTQAEKDRQKKNARSISNVH